jgi:hypothetical protein
MALSPVGNRTGARRMKRIAGALGTLALGAAVLAGCDPNAASPGGPAVSTLTTDSSTYSPSSSPSTLETTTAVPETSAAPAVAPAPVTQAPAAAKKTTKPAAPKTTQAAAPPKVAACTGDTYRNVDGNCVQRPGSSPSGATAKCKDGTYSYSQNRRGTCSGHGGVAQWL